MPDLPSRASVGRQADGEPARWNHNPLTDSFRSPVPPPRRRFQLVLIKPSHYDDDGYVIRWWRGMIPSEFARRGLRHRRPIAPSGRCSARTSPSTSTPSTNPPPASTFPGLLARFRAPWRFRPGRARRRPVEPVSARPRYRPAVPRRPECPWRWAAFTSRAACRCSTGAQSTSMPAARWASRCLPARRRADSTRSCTTPPMAGSGPIYNFVNDLPGSSGTPAPFLPEALRFAHARPEHELRRRPRLPVPMLVLHDHQCPGPQVALPLGRRRRASRPAQLAAGHQQVLHHRRQLRAQQGVGSDPRPPDRASREGRHPARPDDPGRHALPQDPALRREVEARRRHPRLHRPREHQPRQPGRRQEAAEQDHRIPEDAARLEGAGHHHHRRLHPRLSRPTPRRRSGATSRSFSTSCRSTSSSSSA